MQKKSAEKLTPNGRVHRAGTTGFTMINNRIFCKEMSLAAFGLLVMMLQLSSNWHYTVEGLAVHVGCAPETIEGYLRELEALGHLVRHDQSRSCGKFSIKIWDIYEISRFERDAQSSTSLDDDRMPSLSPSMQEPLTAEPPMSERLVSVLSAPKKPVSAQPAPEDSAQINNKTINNKCTLIKKSSNNLSSEAEDLLDELKRAMSYDGFLSDFPEQKENLDTLFLLLAEAEHQSEPVSVGNETIAAEDYCEAVFSINEYHIQYILQCLNKSAPVIHNTKAYLQRCMLNAVKQLDNDPSLYPHLIN